MIKPTSLDELVEAVRTTPRLLPVGAGTKPRLAAVDAVKLSTAGLSGIIEYEPSEFTFTAYAGTPVREIVSALAERGQFLPFDPVLVDAGSTLGGMIASGLSGPGRFRYGGVRDFILGVRFVDGLGRLLRLGGKVVKNAAGFDLPKFFVGSLGRFGVVAEATFKVFPQPASNRTLQIVVDGIEAATKLLMEASNTRWEPYALDLWPDGKSVLLRLGAPASALDALAGEIAARWPAVALSDDEAAGKWAELRELRWAAPEDALVKVAVTPADLPSFHRLLHEAPGVRLHVSAGGNVAYISAPNGAVVDRQLRLLKTHGVLLRGEGPLWCGARNPTKIAQDIKHALDPERRFPSLDEG